jgi:uncharacterized protein (DUF362 family)
MTSKVSLTQASDHFSGTLVALNAVGETFLPRLLVSKNVVIKVNFVAAVRELATTPAQSVAAFLDFVRSSGYEGPITIAETAVMGSAAVGFKLFGFHEMARKYDATLFDLRKDDSFPVTILDASGGEIQVPYSRTLADAGFLVSMTRPKTHDTVVATLSIKNVAVGGLIKSRSSVHQGKMIHPDLVRIVKVRAPDLGILDGIVGMQGNGPIAGSPMKSGWVAVGTDLLALDSLAVYLMGFKLENVGYLQLLKEENFGNCYPGTGVEIIGNSPEELVRKYKPHSSYSRQIHWR